MAVTAPALALLLGLLAGAAGADEAEDAVVQLDATRSQVGFRVKFMWLINVEGEFAQVHGTVRRDRFRNLLRVDARIDVDSVDMDSPRYEEWAKSPAFFDMARHPRIEFASDPFPAVRLRSGGELGGTLTLRGVSQPVAFRLLPSSCERPAFDCAIEVRGAIRRSAFALGARHGALGDKVDLSFDVYALTPDTAAASLP
ncbi:MAG: YceI family protein [Rhodanobacteraceae bacterium]|nr:YceI family protein [Rhodanobacteraceae bacterium]